MKNAKSYKIIVIEPSKIITEGLKTLIGEHSEYKITHCVNDFYQCVERLSAIKPDIIIANPTALDFRHRVNVRSLSPTLKHTTLVALSYAHMEEDITLQYNAVISIYDTAAQITKKLRTAIEQNDASSYTSDSEDLSDREREILTSVARGMTNKEIADIHHISVYTVISHRKNITRKTGIKTVSGLTVYALLNNLLSMTDVE
ncbi:MAG: LuxR C-terminal-related transcriptional regulator [Flavobacteriales bacterium]|nr:LuxR C-terminal-related transcriptional regulator [Flavobacteriales bacterium]